MAKKIIFLAGNVGKETRACPQMVRASGFRHSSQFVVVRC